MSQPNPNLLTLTLTGVLMKQIPSVRVIYYFLARGLPHIHIMYPLALLVAPTAVKPLPLTTTTACINTSNINVLICLMSYTRNFHPIFRLCVYVQIMYLASPPDAHAITEEAGATIHARCCQ